MTIKGIKLCSQQGPHTPLRYTAPIPEDIYLRFVKENSLNAIYTSISQNDKIQSPKTSALIHATQIQYMHLTK